jgi:tetratricopeptide (TPR) repeat protein
MALKSNLLALYLHQDEECKRFISALSAAEIEFEGTPETWSVKDIIAHIATWNRKMARTLELAARGDTPEPYGNLIDENAEMFEQNRDLAWSETLEMRTLSMDRLVTAIMVLPEQDLANPDRYSWQNGRPLYRTVVYVTYYHAMSHLAEFYVKSGERNYADQIQERAADLQRRLDKSQGWQAGVAYNLACYYSVNGNLAQAVSGLEEAFELNPDLIQWSKKDSEIDPLKNEPGYLKLLTG